LKNIRKKINEKTFRDRGFGAHCIFD